MIVLKTSRELAIMREAGRISAMALKVAGEAVEPGVSTWEIDRVARKYIESQGAVPSFLGYGGFPRQRLYIGEQCGHPRHTVQAPDREGWRHRKHRYWSHV